MKGRPAQPEAARVLVINGDITRLAFLSGLLETEGFNVRRFERADTALLSLDANAVPDIVVTDMDMPGIDGWRFCRLLRSPEYAAFNRVPILLVSATLFGENTLRITIDPHVDALFTSPGNGRSLVEQVRKILRDDQKQNPLRVLIAENDRPLAGQITKAFTAEGYQADAAFTARAAAAAFSRTAFDVAILDSHLPDGEGDQLLDDFLKIRPDGICIVTAADPGPERALSWMRRGAAAYLRRPFDPAYLCELCSKVRMERALLGMQNLLGTCTRETRESESRFRTIVESFEDIYYQTDREGRITLVSPSVYRLYGWKPEELIGLPAIVFCETPPDRMSLIKIMAEQGCVRDHEVNLIRADGTKATASLSAHLLYDENGEVTGRAGSLRDITERKRMEKALTESENRFRSFFMQAPIGVFMYDKTLHVMDCNERFAQIVQSSREKIIGLDLTRLRTTAVIPLLKEALDDRVSHYEGPYTSTTSDATTWVSFKITPLHDADGHVMGGIGAVDDISKRRLMETALRESEQRFRTILNEMEEGYQEVDLAGNFTFVNEAFMKIFGYGKDEILGTHFRHYVADEASIKRVYQVSRQVYRTGIPVHGLEFEIKRKDGARRMLEFFVSLLTDADHRPVGLRGIARDITDRRRMQEEQKKLQAQLAQAQKMESVGRLAGGIAHDFNNMLGVILGRAEMAMMKTNPAQSPYKDLQEIKKAAERSADLTRQLLAFARKQTVAPKVLNLNEVVSGMLKMLRRLIGEDIDLVWLPNADIWTVKIDPSQIDQVLANLCVNARDAISGVGKVTIETGKAVFDESYCTGHPGFVPGDYTLLSVSDDGCGMDKETLDKLFEPFFTTKSTGKGTGLGLATVYGIVKQNDGFINVYSEPEYGTTFKIYLPRHMGKSERTQKDEPAATSPPGNETILVAEDEPTILELTAAMLQHLGYTVLQANTPGEAIRIAEEYTGKIHLLLTDVVMPEMNGRVLAQKILSLYPDIKRLFMSGYTANTIAHHGVLDEEVHFIQKPFSLNELAAKLNEVLKEK